MLSSIIGSIQNATQFTYVPAEMHIRTHTAEMEANWTPVWEELGLPRPLTVAHEIKQQAQSEIMNGIAQKARDGDRIANLKTREKNVFGNMAMERYIQKGQREVTLVAAPAFGVNIDVKIIPPEIRIETRGVERK
ncbi:hypothetical protein PAE9249_00482 [Paenibacillus sp. CECT 9249]|uniref:DUF6470 family protein n=1 Tax=Paenibacillus sp. CECT 9249 TaxID=2845385 RepID=UPI001EF9BB40|nr:DUF6470 family protein [Paenibacillus sp. CECT 9249]CAH0118017.1 hypothetical protein PAE9249_00482 [Paenibacillus sp. CECT 9249]